MVTLGNRRPRIANAALSASLLAVSGCERVRGPDGFVVAHASVVACTDDQGIDLVTATVESARSRRPCSPEFPESRADVTCERLRALYVGSERRLCDGVVGVVSFGGETSLFGWATVNSGDEQAFDNVIESTCQASGPTWQHVTGSLLAADLDAASELGQLVVDVDGAYGSVSALYCDFRDAE